MYLPFDERFNNSKEVLVKGEIHVITLHSNKLHQHKLIQHCYMFLQFLLTGGALKAPPELLVVS